MLNKFVKRLKKYRKENFEIESIESFRDYKKDNEIIITITLLKQKNEQTKVKTSKNG